MEKIDLSRGTYYTSDEQTIDFYDELINGWYEEAREITLDNLMVFIRKLMDGYEHNYDSYVHAVTACAIATANAAGDEMSGAQAAFVSVLFPKHFFYWTNYSGVSVRDWDKMLFPQYKHNFDRVVRQSTWLALQERAKELYKSDTSAPSEIRAHWKSIIDGKVPFGYKVKNDES